MEIEKRIEIKGQMSINLESRRSKSTTIKKDMVPLRSITNESDRSYYYLLL